MTFQKILIAVAAGLVVALGAQSTARAKTATFDFNSVPVGLASPLTLTQYGITVTFTDDFGLPALGKPYYDDGQFAVGPAGSIYSSHFSGNVLSSGEGYAGAFHPLVMLFSQPVYAISLDFGTSYNPLAPPPALLSAYSGSTLVGTQTVTPQNLVVAPEGVFNFSSATPFDSVWVADSAEYLTVDNVRVNASPSPVPEASTLISTGLLLCLGVGGVLWSACRKERKAE